MYLTYMDTNKNIVLNLIKVTLNVKDKNKNDRERKIKLENDVKGTK